MNKRLLAPAPWMALVSVLIFTLLLSSNPALAETQQMDDQVPGPVAIITAADFNTFTYVRPSVRPQSQAGNGRTVTFNITYVGVPAAAQTAFQYAADIWAALLTSSQTINVTVNWVNLPGSTLGSAGPTTLHRNFAGAPQTFTWYPVALAESIANTDLNTAGAADINSNFDSMGTNWYFGTDGNPGAGQYDFVSVALHELGHGLGFTGLMRYDDGTGMSECTGISGQGCWGTGTPNNPMIYDLFTEDNGSTALLDTGTYPNPSIALGTALTSNSLFFDGPNANIANSGSRVPIYAPATWSSGSSYAHLNESSYPAGDPNSLMTPQIASAEAVHDPGQVTLCIFYDIGWDAACNPNAVWDGGGATNNWSEADNWDTDQVPGAATDVTFNGTSTKDAIIDSAIPGTISSLTIEAGYTGTVTQTDNITITGSLAQSGGAFIGTAGTLTLNGDGGNWSTTAASNFGDVQIGDGSSLQSVTLMSDVSIGGNLTIADGGLLNPGSNTIRLGGNWLEEGFGFIPGTSTVIFEGSGQTVNKLVTDITLVDEDFSFYDSTTPCLFTGPPPPPDGWVREIGPSGDPLNRWLMGNCAGLAPNFPDSLGHARRWNSAPGGSIVNAWLHTPPAILVPQAVYTLTYNYGVSSAADPSDFAAYYGTSQSSAAMTTQIFLDTGTTSTVWTTAVAPFSVSSAGTYHIGLQNADASSGTSFGAMDDVLLVGRNPLTFYNLTVDGSSSILSTDVVVQNDMTINSGASLNFNGNEATVEGTFANNGRLDQTMDVPGSATTRFFHITDAAGSTDKYFGVDITPAAGMGSTTVTLHGNQPNCSSNPADALINRCFDISPTTPANASIRFWFTEAERNGRDASALVVWHHNGTDWELAGDTPSWSEGGTICASGGGLECWVQVENVSSYSPFVPGDNQQPTAITLDSLIIRERWRDWPLLAAAVLLLLSSVVLMRREEM